MRVERDFPVLDHEGVEYRCKNCDFMCFKAREAYGHAAEHAFSHVPRQIIITKEEKKHVRRSR